MKTITFQIEPELYNQFKVHLARKGFSMKDAFYVMINLALKNKVKLKK